jgi:hypothetical protein
MNQRAAVAGQQLIDDRVVIQRGPMSQQGISLGIGINDVGAQRDALGMRTQISELCLKPGGEREVIRIHARHEFAAGGREAVIECTDDPGVGPADDPDSRIGRSERIAERRYREPL